MTLDEFGQLLDKKLEEKFDIKLQPLKEDIAAVKKDLADVKKQMATKEDLKTLTQTIAGYLA